MAIKAFPWEIRDVEPELIAERAKYFKNEQPNYVRVGPKGYFLPGTFANHAANLYNLQIRSSDIFVSSYPRSGSTLTRELVWIVANDFNKSNSTPLPERFIFLERLPITHPLQLKKVMEESNNDSQLNLMDSVWKNVDEAISPRFLFTHLPLSLLPQSLLETAKVVYVARDPKDVVVSFYHMNRLHKLLAYEGDFKTFWKLFIENSILWTPYFENIKESWEMRHHPNMLFLFYEDMIKDMPAVIRQVATFLNKTYNEESVAWLCEHLNFDNFKKNKLLNYDTLDRAGLFNSGEQPFIRKGKVGGWRDYFDEEMAQQAEQWITQNLRNTDLRFPNIIHQ